ncbi:DUF3325 domain-containing protein [Sphingomonas psychrotolerans]|uniref:DUF3325 domain-containing protein n=1 Tax=Sphingomonas psychrotolerans TaxID=1327635 RepID=A0A2K8MJV8_9SPHN|nr:DUF3325 domain-containing protein [Sphingomonas psychrotolerans]ATY34160.1 DUF3325 domain-containing protein [Sphingomonas psychrotolerans]
MIAAGLLYLGLFALAAGMSRHAPALLGRWHAPRRVDRLPRAGWVLIALSLVAALLTPDWSRALVTWFGLAPLAAGIVLLSLAFAPRLARVSAVLAIGMAIVGLAFALAGAGAAA